MQTQRQTDRHKNSYRTSIIAGSCYWIQIMDLSTALFHFFQQDLVKYIWNSSFSSTFAKIWPISSFSSFPSIFPASGHPVLLFIKYNIHIATAATATAEAPPPLQHHHCSQHHHCCSASTSTSTSTSDSGTSISRGRSGNFPDKTQIITYGSGIGKVNKDLKQKDTQ